ncbi:Phosphatidylinositol:ceramide inositolphosphotransferase [Smittium culicis]|uniref:Phosphatidylinositol:ceramide inositolphosphotransferase n=1 Tax=Smittium culicis TaxID=133412 RepID=A0A1R1XM50_9FUNG|nr:Phosphatidylinositol:ceramide inositolphosphotransferase [Smittium culicis]OMJ15694.1 Phosphatidylinositol:ceramide inositolphosphotransferase [Smittium culicis]
MNLSDSPKKIYNFIKNRIIVHWKIKKRDLCVIIPVLIIFGLAYQFNVPPYTIIYLHLTAQCFNVLANVASKRSKIVYDSLGFRFVLPDVGFEIIKQTTMLWYTDFCVTLMIIFAVLNLLIYDRPWRYFCRFLLAWSIALILRITTVATTSVPDPRLDCEFITGNPFTSVALHRCGDAIYSGHSTVYAICFMSLVSFSPRNIYGRIATILVGGFALSGSIIIVANRAHYTIDVLIAWYISIGSWYFVGYFWYWHVTKKGRFTSIEFPFGIGKHHVNDSELTVQNRLISLGLDSDGNRVDYANIISNFNHEKNKHNQGSPSAESSADRTVSIINHI